MKKIIIYIICTVMFFQNCEIIYATEKTDVIETFEDAENIETEENLENEENIEAEEDSEGEGNLETEETLEGEGNLETEEELENEENIEIEKDSEGEENLEAEGELKGEENLETEEELEAEENIEAEETSEVEAPKILNMNWDEDDPLIGRALETIYNTNNIQEDIIGDNTYVHHERYGEYMIKKVIDVSKYQGDIDWKEVKASGIDYAIIRAGYRGYGTGNIKTDEKFSVNIQGALDAGIDVGIYFFSQAINESEAIEEACYTLELIEGYDISLPIAIDYEYASNGQGLTGRLYDAKLSKDSATRICNTFCKTIKQHGYSAMVYANKSMLESNLNTSQIVDKYDIWLAHYASETSYTGYYTFWQFSQSERVEGIDSFVDMSFWYIDPQESFSLEYQNIKVEDTLVNRIYGKTRYETAFAIAEEYAQSSGITKFDNIIVTSGLNYADALSGSYLAGKMNAPILLTNGENAEYIKTYIKENVRASGCVYVLGGKNAVPEGLCCGLKEFDVKRLWGETRYETNLSILKEAGIETEPILICSGKNFPDSLSASATQKPIILVGDVLTEQQEKFLANNKGRNFYIIGGENAISKEIEKDVQKYGTVQRIGGADRYETSVLIAETFFESPDNMILAYSQSFPDGLCGGPLAANLNAPMVLSRTGKENQAKVYAEKNEIHRGNVLGGEILISDNSCKKILGELSKLESEISAKIQGDENEGWKIGYHAYLKHRDSVDDYYYFMRVNGLSGKIVGEPLASVTKSLEISMSIRVTERSAIKELLMDKVALAIKTNTGSYQLINTPIKILNPEAIAKNRNEIFKASSKKGIQGASYASNGSEVTDARYSNTKHTLFNLDIASVVSDNPKNGYVEYLYKGNTYYFSNCAALQESIKSLNQGYKQYLYGNNDMTKVSVTLCLLLGYDTNNKYLIDASARTSGHDYYMLNVREKQGRETLEALFLYLGELFGQEDCYVTNWVLGNEINSSKAWNYSGNMNFDTYIECYTTAFEMLYYGVKSEKTGNTVSISLDNGWTAIPDTYAGKTTLDTFAKRIHEKNPGIEWSIAYHPYSYPLTRTDFWNDSKNTTNSNSTKYISMKNINVLTNYASSLEKKYGKETGSIRVLLTEQGYSGKSTSSKDTYLQAEALARGYYIAEFNDRIDAFIIRALLDDDEEVKGKLYLGLMDYKQNKKTAFYVYEYMDSDLSKLKQLSAQSVVTAANYGDFNNAKKILCNTNWKSIVSGFDVKKLATIK